MLKSPALAMTDWAFLFVNTLLPGENGDFNLFKQLPVAGNIKEKVH